MFALLLILPVQVHDVDFFIVNRILNGKGGERWYVSFWTVHRFPLTGTMRVPVLCNRGWVSGGHVSRASGGWAVDSQSGDVVFARRLWLVTTGFDFERRHRAWFREIR